MRETGNQKQSLGTRNTENIDIDSEEGIKQFLRKHGKRYSSNQRYPERAFLIFIYCISLLSDPECCNGVMDMSTLVCFFSIIKLGVYIPLVNFKHLQLKQSNIQWVIHVPLKG